MTKVLFLPEVVDQFLELAEVLYEKGYLGFKEVAVNYSQAGWTDSLSCQVFGKQSRDCTSSY